jgi:hypothetical protein
VTAKSSTERARDRRGRLREDREIEGGTALAGLLEKLLEENTKLASEVVRLADILALHFVAQRMQRNATIDATIGNDRAASLARGDQDSLSLLSDLTGENAEKTERESDARGVAQRMQRNATIDATARNGVQRAAPDARGRHVHLDDALTPELVAIADLATVQDVKGTWAKFCGHYDTKWLDSVQGAWQRWCVNEAKRERVERERQREQERESGMRIRKVDAGPPKPAPMPDDEVQRRLKAMTGEAK